jgi:hypothetical protein
LLCFSLRFFRFFFASLLSFHFRFASFVSFCFAFFASFPFRFACKIYCFTSKRNKRNKLLCLPSKRKEFCFHFFRLVFIRTKKKRTAHLTSWLKWKTDTI